MLAATHPQVLPGYTNKLSRMHFENQAVRTSCISNILTKVDHVMAYKKRDVSVYTDLLDLLCACENFAHQKETQASCQLCYKYETKVHCAKQAEQ